ncbi:unnamed protein product [Pleuronectes platessa]|uniref:Uncharacterized protein n=1 Tax=Pleuronectes platessa TaxID=8262 RepID=A0A9N7VV35_PLEPL|nr:unnamed protein product [Pleuronectes platessa]
MAPQEENRKLAYLYTITANSFHDAQLLPACVFTCLANTVTCLVEATVAARGSVPSALSPSRVNSPASVPPGLKPRLERCLHFTYGNPHNITNFSLKRLKVLNLQPTQAGTPRAGVHKNLHAGASATVRTLMKTD